MLISKRLYTDAELVGLLEQITAIAIQPYPSISQGGVRNDSGLLIALAKAGGVAAQAIHRWSVERGEYEN